MSDRVYIRLGRARRGPFTRDELLRLKSQGQFSRLHEVSFDGSTWRSSAEFFQAGAANVAAETAVDPRTASRSYGDGAPAPAPETDRRLVIGVGAFFVCSLCIFLFAAAHKYGWLGRNDPAKLVDQADGQGAAAPNKPPPNAVEAQPVGEKTRRYWEELSLIVNNRRIAAAKPTLGEQSKAYAALATKIKLLDANGVDVNVARHGASWEGCFQQWTQHYKEAESLPGKAGESMAEWFLKGLIVTATAGKDDAKWADDQVRRDMAERFGRGADNILDVARRKSNLDSLEASLIQEGEIIARTYKL